EPKIADRAGAMARHSGRLQRDRAPAPGRDSESGLRAALCGPLRHRWNASAGQSFYRDEQGKGNYPLPLQPHPQNQPNPNGEGTTLKPDISLATKTGHFNLLPTRRPQNTLVSAGKT